MLLTLLGQYDFVKDVLVRNKRPVDAPLVAMLYYGVRLHLIEYILIFNNCMKVIIIHILIIIPLRRGGRKGTILYMDDVIIYRDFAGSRVSDQSILLAPADYFIRYAIKIEGRSVVTVSLCIRDWCGLQQQQRLRNQAALDAHDSSFE